MSAAMREALGELAEARATGAGAAPNLQLVRDPIRNATRTKGHDRCRSRLTPPYRRPRADYAGAIYVPCYNLPKLHAILMSGPHACRMEVQHVYLSILKLATARPDAGDRPGEIVNNARRSRAGSRISEDQASSGF